MMASSSLAYRILKKSARFSVLRGTIFYKNPTIRRLLDETLEKQVGMPDPRRAVLDRAMDSQLLKLHEMIRSLERENQRLVEENQKLKKALDKRNANQFHRI